ncbi:hypothetical protein QUB70_29485 [Microcoleus sp. A003_D6]
MRLTPQLKVGCFHGAMAILVLSYTIIDLRIGNDRSAKSWTIA